MKLLEKSPCRPLVPEPPGMIAARMQAGCAAGGRCMGGSATIREQEATLAQTAGTVRNSGAILVTDRALVAHEFGVKLADSLHALVLCSYLQVFISPARRVPRRPSREAQVATSFATTARDAR